MSVCTAVSELVVDNCQHMWITFKSWRPHFRHYIDLNRIQSIKMHLIQFSKSNIKDKYWCLFLGPWRYLQNFPKPHFIYIYTHNKILILRIHLLFWWISYVQEILGENGHDSMIFTYILRKTYSVSYNTCSEYEENIWQMFRRYL